MWLIFLISNMLQESPILGINYRKNKKNALDCGKFINDKRNIYKDN